MKQFNLTKRRDVLRWAAVAAVVCAWLFVPQRARANDYLEKKEHYQVYASGQDKIHFKLPVWAYGKGFDYYLAGPSEIWIKKKGSNDQTVVMYFESDRYAENEKKSDTKGTAWLKINNGYGTAIVTSMYNGVNQQIDAGQNWWKMIVKQSEDDGCPQVTWLEFDWYPPRSMGDGSTFTIGINSYIYKSYTGNRNYTKKWDFGNNFSSTNNIITPQLYTPYLYTVTDNGVAGYGVAAVPYMVFQEPKSYTTSFDPQKSTLCTDRSGTIYVETSDTIRKQLQATFSVVLNSTTNQVDTLASTAVDIPPYHRIYDFSVVEETDSTETYTGNNLLTWTIHNPGLKDLLDGDYFEVQRAMESDYSDAQTLEVVPMERNADKFHYTVTDNSRSSWTGNNDTENETVDLRLTAKEDKYVINDANGEPLAELTAQLTSTAANMPGVPVYYRVRRASSAVWGWEHEFARSTTLYKHNYLAPLADNQSNYTKDADFQNNRQVHFNFKIDNKEASQLVIDKDKCKFSYSINKILQDGVGTVDVTIGYSRHHLSPSAEQTTLFRVEDIDGNVVQDWKNLAAGTYKFEIGQTIRVKNSNSVYYWYNTIRSHTIVSDLRINCYAGYSGAVAESFMVYFTDVPTGNSIIDSRVEAVKQSVIDSLCNKMKSQNNLKYGRCMWDRTARLVLVREMEETGQRMEIIIPQDSISRNDDGSWSVHYVDVASEACTHYKYYVRIDQSSSDLHVQDSASLKPVQINGPDLYIDEAASITSFTASQGDVSTELKPGVMLIWQTNTNAVDEFVVLRKKKGSSDSADTLITTTQYNFFDRTATPDQHYDYTVVARYACNGKNTSNSASAEGWRTPYGEISGRVQFEDGSGCNGVTVSLTTGDGEIVSTLVTDETGTYKFDSLSYDKLQCPKLTVYIYFSYAYNSKNPRQDAELRVLTADGAVLYDWMPAYYLQGKREFSMGTVIETRIVNEANANNNKIFSFTLTENGALYLRNEVTDATTKQPIYVPYVKGEGGVECEKISSLRTYIVTPTSQYGKFSFNNTSSGAATITMSQDNAVASGIDFDNTAATRLTGRVLYKNTTIPVSGASFLLNGSPMRRSGGLVETGIDGNFELLIPTGQPCKLQVVKEGHWFEGNGILRVEGEDTIFALTKALDGVRFYDETKVRLVGRVAGGNDQRDLPRGFGAGTNNLGDDLQFVLQLEGDNTAHFVHDPNDLTLDTVRTTVPHLVYSTDPLSALPTDTVGTTRVTLEKKRIIVQPDPVTGEYAVDLFPVKYKVTQATAKGYATLFDATQGSETFDLTNAPQKQDTLVLDSTYSSYRSDAFYQSYKNYYTTYNATYDRIYHTPVKVDLTQLVYGLERDGFGEPEMEVSSMNPKDTQKVPLYTKQEDGTVNYLMGYPVYLGNRKYQFMARAYEAFYYNNDPLGKVDEVPQRGGSVTLHNGLHSSTDNDTYALDETGRNRNIWLQVDNIDTENKGTNALRTVSVVLESEGTYVEDNVFQAFVSGTNVQNGDLTSTESEVVLLDIVRDPGGDGSSSWVESGTTYTFAYTESYDWEIGVELTPKYGVNITQDIGAVTAPQGTGSYVGSTYNSERLLSFTLPITHEWKWGYKHNYSFTTTDRISTSSGKARDNVGSRADVFLGTTVSQLAGKAKTVSVINDSMYIARQPAINAGLMKVLAEGYDANGEKYYLTTGQKVVLGTQVGHTFVYTQAYILNTLIPKLAMERQNLLMYFDSEEAAQNYANLSGEAVYWSKNEGKDVNLRDTLDTSTYKMITPADDSKTYTDRIAALDNMIVQWITILYQNEKEKVLARMSGKQVGTWSLSDGASLTHTESYSASAQYNEMPQGGDLVEAEWQSNSAKLGQSIASNALDIVEFFGEMGGKTIGTSVAEAVSKYFNVVAKPAGEGGEGFEEVEEKPKDKQELGTTSNTSKFKLEYNPVFSYDCDDNLSDEKTIRKTAGFTLGADNHGDITVAVYRAEYDSIWESQSEMVRDNVNQYNNDDLLYGSFVFYTVAGTTYCPHEDEERTNFYNKGTVLNNETQWIDKPELSIDTYEQTGVQPDKRAVFRVTMMNNGQVQSGIGANGTAFSLSFWGDSNPNGAKIYMDGAPLITGVPVFLVPGKAVTKVIEVERGMVDDYENLTLALSVSDCPKTYSTLQFSVHFLPVSSDVNIAMPRQNWIMNTLSQQDSVGYYLPVEIDGFDIHHKNFDHIEFQYKLSTESEEQWVNQCSFYADDSLYNLATGNKAMIENGRIVPFRFYGERDPMEQRYDLRAVSYCRYGSGFVTKASPVISGTKDTRPPRVFGEPQPADAILGVGDDIKLRFNEPIAGNYLDEDNNFQLLGVTNNSGFEASTSLGFDGTEQSFAATKVTRNLSGRSVSIDMLVKPAATGEDAVFFSHGEGSEQVRFGKTADNRLYIGNAQGNIYSKQVEQMLALTRVIATYDAEKNEIRFYAGTLDVTDETQPKLPQDAVSYYTAKAPLVFGQGFRGNMLEVRVWTKALTAAEISETHLRYLTGYERELAAYYRMDEGRGTTITDYANGATLYAEGTTWTLPDGFSISLDANTSVRLDGNLLSRNAAQDETLMLWFRNTSGTGDVFRAGYKKDSKTVEVGHYETDTLVDVLGDEPPITVTRWKVDGDTVVNYEEGTRLFIEDGMLKMTNHGTTHDAGRGVQTADTRTLGTVTTGEWEHLVMSVNRTYNNVSVYLNGNLTTTFAATDMAAMSGAMYLGGNGFEGNVDEFTIFEQALPKSLVEVFDNLAPYGDEMGLMAYLPFEEEKLNANGILELVFSPNDQREFKTSTGAVVSKTVPLVLEVVNEQTGQPSQAALSTLADKRLYAPVRDHGKLTKLNFDWAFNQDELLINLNMADKEINKQSIYITVRDVEDLNGNPMASPVMWTAFVDHNSLKWDYRELRMTRDYSSTQDTKYFIDVSFSNKSGKRHQYTIESLPQWLTASTTYGSIDPAGYQNVTFTFDSDLAVGEYSDLVYLTDENGLSEPLHVQYIVYATCPYGEVDRSKYPLNMSVCGQVTINGMIDTDEDDRVIALYRNECIGMAGVDFDANRGTSKVYLTVYGNDVMKGSDITFLLWQASTGKTHVLNTSEEIRFEAGSIHGCGSGDPVVFSTGGSETQNIELNQGWNWISFNIDVQDDASGRINSVMTAAKPWTDGDLIKNPFTRAFCVYSEDYDRFAGSLSYFNASQINMVYTQWENTMRVAGNALPADSMHITLRGGGEWSSFPCFLNEATSVTETLSDYYDYATAGDLVKSHDQFAIFSRDGKWEGDLKFIRPGVGYMFRRQGEGNVTINFFNKTASNVKGAQAARRAPAAAEQAPEFTNPQASTNMTMIAALDGTQRGMAATRLLAYVGDERLRVGEPSSGILAGVARPQVVDGDTLFFLTISSDHSDRLRFVLEAGDESYELSPLTSVSLAYEANTHRGTLRAPVMLGMSSEEMMWPADVRFYSATGQLIGELRQAVSLQQVRDYLNRLTQMPGLYNAVINGNNETRVLKIVR